MNDFRIVKLERGWVIVMPEKCAGQSFWGYGTMYELGPSWEDCVRIMWERIAYWKKTRYS